MSNRDQLCRAMDDLVQASIALQDGKHHYAAISLYDALVTLKASDCSQLDGVSHEIVSALVTLGCDDLVALKHTDVARRQVARALFKT